MTVIAISGDHAVLVAVERGLEADRNRFLADVQVAEAADQAEPVELAGAFLEPANEQHLLVEVEQLFLAGLEPRVLFERVLQRVERELAVLCW